jgi:hypothetical protein
MPNPTARTAVCSPGLGASDRDPERLCRVWRLPDEFVQDGHEPRDVGSRHLRIRLHPWARLRARHCDNSIASPTELPRPTAAFPPRSGWKMRPADTCKPELSKTSTRASGAYRRVAYSTVRRCAARFTPSRRALVRRSRATLSVVGSRSPLRLASDASSSRVPRPYGTTRATEIAFLAAS